MAAPLLDLQPRTGGDIIDAAVTLYRRHFSRVITLAAIPLPFLLLTTFWMEALEGEMERPRNTLFYVRYGLVIVGHAWFYFLRDGALSRWTSEILQARRPGVGRCYLPLLRRCLSVMCLLAVYMIAIGGPFVLPIAILTMAFRNVRSTAGAILVLILFLGPAVFGVFFVLIRLTVGLQVIAVENVGCSRAVARSWRLVRGNTWRAGAITLFTLALNLAPAALDQVMKYLVDPEWARPGWEAWWTIVLLAVGPFSAPWA